MDNELRAKRAGNFCASENHRLMAGWEKPLPSSDYIEFNDLYLVMKDLQSKPLVRDLKNLVNFDISGDLINRTWQIIQDEKPPMGLVTYAQEKAVEQFFYPDPSLNFSTAHTRNGNEREDECLRLLSEKTGIDFVNTGDEQMHICADEVGCTPDALVFDDLDLIQTGAEAKCKSPLIHTRNMLIRTTDELKESAFDHFTQMQTCMYLTGADYWYFANYNPYASFEQLIFGYIVVEKDDRFISALLKRIEIAKKIKAEFIANIESKLIRGIVGSEKKAA